MLAWMREHGDVLRALLAEEGAGEDDTSPGGDAAVRAHLRFAGASLLANVRPQLTEEVSGFVEGLSAWFEEGRPLYEEHLATGAGAMALEEHLQFGARPGSDPSLDEGLSRRLRIGGWTRVFLLGLELRLGPEHDGIAREVLDWIGARQRELSRLILALDREAKIAARRAGAGGIDLPTQDGIAQAASVQGHVRMLVEALGAALGGEGARPPA